jgi:DNA-binding MarR family transcriptional regulator
MRSLADEWQCDPSNATWIIDRLETLGLAERRGLANNRRVRLVALTAKGSRTRSSLMKEFYQPPPELAALDREELQSLDRILAKLAPRRPLDSSETRHR